MSAPYTQKIQLILRPDDKDGWEATIIRNSNAQTRQQAMATEQVEEAYWEMIIEDSEFTCDSYWYPIYFSEIAGYAPSRLRCLLMKYL